MIRCHLRASNNGRFKRGGATKVHRHIASLDAPVSPGFPRPQVSSLPRLRCRLVNPGGVDRVHLAVTSNRLTKAMEATGSTTQAIERSGGFVCTADRNELDARHTPLKRDHRIFERIKPNCLASRQESLVARAASVVHGNLLGCHPRPITLVSVGSATIDPATGSLRSRPADLSGTLCSHDHAHHGTALLW